MSYCVVNFVKDAVVGVIESLGGPNNVGKPFGTRGARVERGQRREKEGEGVIWLVDEQMNEVRKGRS